MEKPKRYAKPEGFKGRGNSTNYKKDKWECVLYDKESGTIKQGKYPTKQKLIEGMNLDLTPDIIYRIYSGNKVDTGKTKKESSFLSKYGHIKISKIL